MIGERVRLAREACGMTQTGLASAAGVSQGTVSDIEHGRTMMPSETIVDSVASATGFPKEFFYLGPLPDFPEGSFRKLRRGTVRTSDQVRAQVRHVAEVVQRAEGCLPLPPVLLQAVRELPRGSADIEDLAVEVRSYLRVGDNDPIPNLTRSVERAGVVVVKMPVEMVDHDGFSVWPEYGLGGRPLIAISRDMPGDRARFTIAHELGHLLLHTARLKTDPKTAESEAHRFAGALIVPETAARELIRVPVTLGTLMRVKAMTGASIAMLAKRAVDLQIIDHSHFVSLRKQLSARGWHKNEPVEVGDERTLLIGKLLEAMGGDGSWSDRANRLSMQTFNLRSLVAG